MRNDGKTTGMPDFETDRRLAGVFDVPDTLTQNFRGLIVRAVSGKDGISEDDLICKIVAEVEFDIDLKGLKSLTFESLNYLVGRGDVVRLEVRAEGRLSVGYFPKDSSFDVQPAHLAPPPPDAFPALNRPLSHHESLMLESLKASVDACMNMNPDIVVRLVSLYCPACGSRREGHVCTNG